MLKMRQICWALSVERIVLLFVPLILHDIASTKGHRTCGIYLQGGFITGGKNGSVCSCFGHRRLDLA